jgi:hypothetical protein
VTPVLPPSSSSFPFSLFLSEPVLAAHRTCSPGIAMEPPAAGSYRRCPVRLLPPAGCTAAGAIWASGVPIGRQIALGGGGGWPEPEPASPCAASVPCSACASIARPYSGMSGLCCRLSTDLFSQFVHTGCAHVSLASRTSQRLTNADLTSVHSQSLQPCLPLPCVRCQHLPLRHHPPRSFISLRRQPPPVTVALLPSPCG